MYDISTYGDHKNQPNVAKLPYMDPVANKI